MNYKQKYNEALERMKSWAKGEHPECFSEAQKAAEFIFPELKENGDERIRKEIIDFLELPHPQFVGKRDHEKWIAWLEKQGQESKKVSIWKHWKNGIAGNGEGRQVYLIRTGNTYNLSSVLSFECDYIELSELDKLMLEKQEEKATHINREDCGIDGLYHAIKILERTIGRVTGYQSDDGILSHEAAIDAVKELYKKQGGQEHFYDFNANDWYVSKVDGKIHDMTYNPTDKVEPKFRVGDWVVKQDGESFWNGDCVAQITNITDCGEHWLNFDCWIKAEDIRLWTIQDAKDGDVLVSKDNRPFIFTGEFDVQDDNPTAYCGIDSSDKFIIGKGSHWTFKDGIKPATKEQRDLLFQKMKEEGYEWDADKKELKKIEVKTLDANKVIEWLKNTIKETKEYINGAHYNTRLILPYNYSIEDLINDFKEDFGL